MAGVKNLLVDQGETFRWLITYARRETPETPEDQWELVDLDGCTARMQIREKYGSPVLAELTTENGGITLGEEPGVIDIYMDEEQSDALGVKEESSKPRVLAYYDLEVVYPSGDVDRVIQGAITIDPNITREDEETSP